MGLLFRLTGAVLVVVCAAGWLSLLTWSAADPSLSHATGTSPRNLLGPLGAVVSDLALQMLGMAAIFAFLAPAYWGVQFALNEFVPGLKAKAALYPLSILVLAAALSSLPIVQSWPLNHGYGGVIGDLVLGAAALALSLVNPQRAELAAGIMLFAGGFASLFASLGLTHKDILLLFKPGKAAMGAAEGGLTGRAKSFGYGLAQTVIPAGLGAMLGRGGRREPHLGASPAPAPGFCPADANETGNGWGGGSSNPAPAGKPDQPAGHSDKKHGDRGQAFDPRLDFGVKREQPSAPQGQRGPGFKARTDRESSTMAARFSPFGAGKDAGADEAKKQLGGKAGTNPGGDKSTKVGSFLNGLKSFRAEALQYKRPSLNLLQRPAAAKPGPEFTQTVLRGNARLLEDALSEFGIKGEVKDIRPGPVVTLFELEPAAGTKAARVIALADDIARAMSASSVRIALVPGRNLIGIELPNLRREKVVLRELLETEGFRSFETILPLALGKSIAGNPIVADLARMEHLLIAGAVGSGRSSGLHAMILSLIYRMRPDECRLLMIDPKMLALSVYNGIPHLLCPVVSDPHKALSALAWVVREMEERLKRMSQLGVRSIDIFNNRVKNAKKRGETLARTVQTGFDQQTGQAIFEKEEFDLKAMPYIVVAVDEFADLMSVAGRQVEAHVQAISLKARAAGIHLIMATQRPSADIVTSAIKAQFPNRIGFKLASKIDSRTILDESGAEQLLGEGDMLYRGGTGQSARVHGVYVSGEEVEQIASSLRDRFEPEYIEGVTDGPPATGGADGPGSATVHNGSRGSDDLYERAVAIVLRDDKASASHLQRRLMIDFEQAKKLIGRMEAEGIAGADSQSSDRQGRRDDAVSKES